MINVNRDDAAKGTLAFAPNLGEQTPEEMTTPGLMPLEQRDHNLSLRLKLLLIKHGKCFACSNELRVKYCERCFDTGLEPNVLEAITALDLGTKFEQNDRVLFENVSEDDYIHPRDGSYFSYVIQRKKILVNLYRELLRIPAGTTREAEAIRKLMDQVLA